MTSTNNITRKKMDGVTILRFIAAFYVFIFHINMRVPVNFGELINKTISNGVIGMSIFFMLSGFVLTYNYYGFLVKQLLQEANSKNISSLFILWAFNPPIFVIQRCKLFKNDCKHILVCYWNAIMDLSDLRFLEF